MELHHRKCSDSQLAQVYFPWTIKILLKVLALIKAEFLKKKSDIYVVR